MTSGYSLTRNKQIYQLIVISISYGIYTSIQQVAKEFLYKGMLKSFII